MGVKIWGFKISTQKILNSVKLYRILDPQHSTPCDRDENMTEENPAALRGRRFDPHPEPIRETPKPPDWPHMTARQKHNWSRRHNKIKKGDSVEEGGFVKDSVLFDSS
jgi:hypothetical protein